MAETCNLNSHIGNRSHLPDHSVLHVTFQVSGLENITNTTEVDSPILNNVYTFHKRKYRFENVPNLFLASESWKHSMNELIEWFLECRANQEEVDNRYNRFCEVLTKEMTEHLKYSECSKTVRKRYKNYKPYWNEKLHTMWKELRDVEKNYIKVCKSNGSRNNLKRVFIDKRKMFDKTLRRTERSYRKNMLIEIDNVCTKDPREFWNHINKLGPRVNTNIPMKVYDVNGVLNSDFKTVLDKWKDDFKSLYDCSDNIHSFNREFYDNVMLEKDRFESQMEEEEYVANLELNHLLSFDEIEHVVNNLKMKKSTGIDEIPNEVLKHHDVMLLLYYFYVKCFETGILPSVWLKAIIIPIPKSTTKDPHVPLNYRGISLLSCVCKVFTAIINRRIVNYCELGNLFVEEQNGFRKNRSCIDHIFSLTSLIRNRFAENKDTFACFIDMQKAFDWVDRDMLFYKLLSYNIDGFIYKCIKALYNHPLSCIKINSCITEWFTTENGVRQGDSLSPTLFAIFINDLVKELNEFELGIPVENKKISVLLFADDIVISGENEQELQTLLKYVEIWCRKWRMKINQDKTQIVHYRKKHKGKTKSKFTINDTELEIVNTYKYLGVYLDQHLDFSITGESLAGAAGRALGKVIAKFKNFRNVGFLTYEKLYNNGVVPILDYCSGVWGFKKIDSCSKIQQRALRYYLGVHNKTPLLAIEGDTGWLNCQVRRHIEMCRFWNRIINMEDSRLTKIIFEWDYSKCKGNWCQEIKELFESVDENCFVNKSVCNLESVQFKLRDKWSENWKNSLISKPKLRTYVLFKEEYVTEDFVKYCYSRSRRSLIAQLRCGVLPLHIETGRFRNLKPEERLCSLCNLQEVEDELHFICKCEALVEPRNVLYEMVQRKYNMFINLDIKEKFIHLMKYEWKQMSIYIEKAWYIRRNIMYEHL